MSFTRGFRKLGGFPKDGEMVDNPGRFSREGWVHRADHESVHIGGKQYRNMREWTRPCVVCGDAVTAYEKNGTVDASSRFGNRTCKNHRGLLPALERGFIVWNAELKGIVPGASCASKDVPAPIGVDGAELEKLRTANATMKDELAGLYARNSALFAENEGLKARLGAYELEPAMAAVQRVIAWTAPQPLGGAASSEGIKTPDSPTTERLRQEWIARQNGAAKLPWEGA